MSKSVPVQSGALLGATLAAIILSPAAFAQEAGEDADQAAPIVVTAPRGDSNPNANADASYKVEQSQNDKFTESLKDTPKTVIAIPKEVMEDMGAASFRELVRSTPGVTLGTGEGGNAFGDRIFIRGFEARNDVYIDGLRDPGVTSRDIFAVEQIEVIKGPAGSFGGRGTTGGLVSLESKRPKMGELFTRVDAGVGTENFFRGAVDTNIPVGDRFAVRVNGVYHTADTPGRNYVSSERYGGTIAAAFQATDTLRLSADYYYYRLDGVPDYGHPFNVKTQEPYSVDFDSFYGVIGRDFLTNGADIGTFRVDFDPIEALSIRSVTRIGRTWNRYLAAAPGGVCRVARTTAGACPTGGTLATPTGVDVGEANYTVAAGSQRRWGTNHYIANVTDATATFKTGSIGHTVVMGGEFASEKVNTLPLLIPAFVEDASGNVVSTPTTFIRKLVNPNPVLGYSINITPDRTNGPTVVKVDTMAAYLIDTIKFSPKIWVTLGGRLDSYALSYRADSRPTALRLRNNVDFWNWQASLTWKPVDALTAYASFATSANPSGEQLDGNGIAYDGIGAATQALEPEHNKSWEAGLKWETSEGKLLVTGAVFQIDKTNARENIGGGVFDLVGKLRSRGAEFGVNGKLGDRLQLFGGYTYTDATIVASATAANVGRRFANVPRHTANLLATVQVLHNLEIGGQAHWQSRVFGGTVAAGTASFPGYARFDLVTRWKAADWLEARLNVNNVMDKRYYDTIYRSASPFTYVAPGRSAVLTLTARM